MSEELIKRGLTKNGLKISHYQYYDVGDSTLDQLKRYKIIPEKSYGKYSARKPDGLLVDRQNTKQINVIAVVEHKQPSDFNTDKKKTVGTQQCNDVCQILNANVGIITDGKVTIWINPKQNNKDNDYTDRTTNIKRSYSIIRNDDKKDLSEKFILQNSPEIDFKKLDDDTRNTIFYIERILSSVTDKNSTLVATEEVDPLGLAQNVWQDIYINTGKDPTKCLYNVVELFIFKFLSDLGILKSPNNFDFIMSMYDSGSTNKEVLEHYATTSRKKIKDLFPKGADNTTIINGTIFVDTKGVPVQSQANLFKNSLIKFKEFGSLKNVKKEFKTKLFETFLKQSQDKSKLGQFFTPRKVVRAIVEMADVENLSDGSRVCDPFCGVGGFILEPLHITKRKNDFIPRAGKIKSKITYQGFDKGTDEDEERTIILAKANMLIYLSEIIEKYPTLTTDFANEVFNKTFHLITDSNLGTLKRIITNENDKYDLIMTNPPYVTRGVKSIRDEITSENLDDFYTAGGQGLSGLALEWVIKSLKKNGKAYIILNDAVFYTALNKSLREFILKECFINCILSLPVKTFFNTPKKTFILGVTKKEDDSITQELPVFTYLISNIGETLDVDRFEIEGKSDLVKAKDLFNLFKGSPKHFPIEEIGDKRCKLQPINKFYSEKSWDIDKWWSKEERIALGVSEEENKTNVEGFKELVEKASDSISEYKKPLKKLIEETKVKFKEVPIRDLFDLERGRIISKQYLQNHKGDYPVYSSNTLDEYFGKINTFNYDCEALTWTTDGIYAGTIFYRNGKFSITNVCGIILLKKEVKNIYLPYIQKALDFRPLAKGTDNKKVMIDTIINADIKINIPVKVNGEYDMKAQKEITEKYEVLERIKKELKNKLDELVDVKVEFI